MISTHLSMLDLVSSDQLPSLSRQKSPGIAFVSCSEMGLKLPGMPKDPDLQVSVWQNICCFAGKDLISQIATGSIEHVVVYEHYPCSFVTSVLSEDLDLDELSDPVLAQQARDVLRHASNLESDCNETIVRKVTENLVRDQLCRLSLLLQSSSKKPRRYGWLWSERESRLYCLDPGTDSFIVSS